MENAVFVLESPSLEDVMSGRREAPLVTETLRTLGISHFSESVRTMAELEVSGRLFSSAQFRVLHVSAHGENEGKGIFLSDNTLVPWSEFLPLFRFGEGGGFLTVSACSALKGGWLEHALVEIPHTAADAIGPNRPITWKAGALVSASLIQSLRNTCRHDIMATLAGLYLTFGIDLHALVVRANKNVQRISGSWVLEQLIRSLLARDKTVFMDLIRSRGLLDDDERSIDWEKYWKDTDDAKDRLRVAMDNTDRVMGWGKYARDAGEQKNSTNDPQN